MTQLSADGEWSYLYTTAAYPPVPHRLQNSPTVPALVVEDLLNELQQLRIQYDIIAIALR